VQRNGQRLWTLAGSAAKETNRALIIFEGLGEAILPVEYVPQIQFNSRPAPLVAFGNKDSSRFVGCRKCATILSRQNQRLNRCVQGAGEFPGIAQPHENPAGSLVKTTGCAILASKVNRVSHGAEALADRRLVAQLVSDSDREIGQDHRGGGINFCPLPNQFRQPQHRVGRDQAGMRSEEFRLRSLTLQLRNTGQQFVTRAIGVASGGDGRGGH